VSWILAIGIELRYSVVSGKFNDHPTFDRNTIVVFAVIRVYLSFASPVAELSPVGPPVCLCPAHPPPPGGGAYLKCWGWATRRHPCSGRPMVWAHVVGRPSPSPAAPGRASPTSRARKVRQSSRSTDGAPSPVAEGERCV